MKHEKDWYKELVIYQIYPRSFKDGNGDGIGDFELCCPKKGPVIAYTRSFQNETWLVIHNFSEKEQIFEHDRIQGTETIILSNYDESAKEREKIRLRAYETMILEL